MDPLTELRSRPTYEQTSSDYLAVLGQVRDVLARLAPQVTFAAAPSEESRTVCAQPFDRVDGADAGIFTGGLGVGAITDEQWPTVVEAVRGVARPKGYTVETVLADRPGRHVISFQTADGENLELGTGDNTTLALEGGCRLRAATHSSPS
jgi:hypothetical protein